MSFNLDLSNLKRFVGDDPELVRQMLLAYTKFLPGNIENIKSAIINNDNEAVLHEIHQLKPNLMNIGVQLGSITFEDLYQKLKLEGINELNKQLLIEAVEVTEKTIQLLELELGSK